MNIIEGNGISGRNDGIITSGDTLMRGIYLWNSTSNVVNDNRTDTLGWHIVARTTADPTTLYCNEMTRGIGGLVVIDTARFGTIGTTSTAFNNQWYGTFTGFKCDQNVATTFPPQRIYVRSTPASQDPGTSWAAPWGKTVVANLRDCPIGPVGGGSSSGTLLADRIAQYQSTWADLDTIDSIPGIARWIILYGMYTDIGNDDSLYADSSMQVIWNTIDTLSSISYYDEYGNPVVVPVNVSTFAQLEQAFWENDTSTVTSLLAVLSGALNPATAYLPEMSLFNALQLGYSTVFLNADTLTSTQTDSLFDIAALCPDQYGLAPLRTHAVLATYGVMEEFEWCGGGGSKWVEPESGSEESIQGGIKDFVVFPNPTTGELRFEWRQAPPDASILICDFVGHVLFSTQTSSASFSLDLSGLAAGVYVYKVVDTINGAKTGQIVLIKEE